MASGYHRLSIGEKQKAHRNRMREPAIACPQCECQTTVADLLRHLETTCQGPREPHPLSDWMSWSEVLELGVPRVTVSRWVRQGRLRVRGRVRQRQYLRRDLVRLVALRKAS